MNIIKEEYLEELKKSIGEKEYSMYIKSLDDSEKHGFTINLKKLKRSTIDLDYIIEKFDAKLIYKNDNFAYLTYDKEKLEKNSVFPGKDPLYHVGLYYIQEPSASKVLYDVDIKSTDAVLDLCASPGGKSCEVLYNLDKKSGGFLVSNEINMDRAKILSSNIERMGFANVIVTNNSASKLSKTFVECFDKVIVDAPCSGEGMFRKSEEARLQWTKGLVTSCAKTQKLLLDEAYKMLKCGGMLIYSTCTFSKEEDEDNVEYIKHTYKNMKLLHAEKNFPHNSIGEGQFFAIFEKEGDVGVYKSSFPTLKELKGLNVLRYGLKVEEEHNGRKEIAHAVTHNDENDIIKDSIELSDDEIVKYLHGEVIRKEVKFSGWCKVTYKGMGVGLVKVVNGVLKNHYPKGLRIL